MTTAVFVCWVALGAAGLLLTLSQVALWIDLYWIRRDSSRFSMFATRDRLVRLVADGDMAEDDLAWAYAYSAANSLLQWQKNHSIWMQFRKQQAYQRRRVVDAAFAERMDLATALLRKRAAEQPAFAQILLLMGNANWEMVNAQTHWWDRLALRVLIVASQVIAVASSPFRHHRGSAGRPLVHPSMTSSALSAMTAERAADSGSQLARCDPSSCDQGSHRPLWYQGVAPTSADELVAWRMSSTEIGTFSANAA